MKLHTRMSTGQFDGGCNGCLTKSTGLHVHQLVNWLQGQFRYWRDAAQDYSGICWDRTVGRFYCFRCHSGSSLQRAAIRITTNLKPSRHVGSLADAQRSASIGLTLGEALMVGFSLPLILIWIRSLIQLLSFIGLPGT